MTPEDPLTPPEGYGTQPQPPARPAGWNASMPAKDGTICDAVVRTGIEILLGAPPAACTALAAIRVTYACEREHLGLADLCAGHEFAKSAMMVCRRCTDAGVPPEECVMTIARTQQHPLSSPS